MKVEAGKFYRTRSGRKAFVGAVNTHFEHLQPVVHALGWEADKSGASTWTAHGRVWEEGEDESDLVAEWREPIKGEAWAYVYDDGDHVFWTSKKSAEELNIDARPIVRIRYEEVPE